MQVLQRPWGAMHYAVSGPAGAPAVVFANSLGTDFRLWDALLPLLPAGLRYIRYDKRGHGLSEDGPAIAPEDGLAGYAADAAGLIEAAAGGPVVFVGLSIGGLIGQRLAADRPDLVRALVISNSAAKLGAADGWLARIAAVRANGIASIADAVMERWFAPAFRATRPELGAWRTMLTRSGVEGYVAACATIAASDQTAATAALRLPVLVLAGSEDGATPPAMVEATAALIPGAAYHCLPGVGHLPCVEDPAAMAALLSPFLAEHSR